MHILFCSVLFENKEKDIQCAFNPILGDANQLKSCLFWSKSVEIISDTSDCESKGCPSVNTTLQDEILDSMKNLKIS